MKRSAFIILIILVLVIGTSACRDLPVTQVVLVTATPWIITATPEPTGTPTATPTPTPTPTITPTPTPPPASVLLKPMNHQAQTINNCGPDSVAIVLGYYGHQVTQQTINDEGLGSFSYPYQVAEFISDSRYGVAAEAYWFPSSDNQSLRLMRYLLANDIPVIVLQRLSFQAKISHYRVIRGYNDKASEFIADDPLLGANHRIPYKDFINLNGAYSYPGPALIPVYPPKMASLVESLTREWGAPLASRYR